MGRTAKRVLIPLLLLVVVLSSCVPMTIEIRPQAPLRWQWTVYW